MVLFQQSYQIHSITESKSIVKFTSQNFETAFLLVNIVFPIMCYIVGVKMCYTVGVIMCYIVGVIMCYIIGVKMCYMVGVIMC